MYITNKTKQYPCTGYYPTENTVVFSGIDGITLPIDGEIKLYRDDGFELATQSCENYALQTYENDTLTITNEPEPVIVEPTLEELTRTQIENLKIELISSDYKIIKCSECSLAGLPLPYNIIELNTERQSLRDQINTLEQQLQTV